MRRYTVFGTLAVVLVLTMATGCWNRRELNDLAVVTAIGVDKAKRGYHVSVQVVDPGEVASGSAGNGLSPVTTYDAVGDTLLEAIRRMTMVTPRRLYFAHLRMFVIGEALARDGIGEALDLFSRDQEGRTDFFIVVARDNTAFDVLKILTPMERIPASKLYSSLQLSERSWAPTLAMQLDELITMMVSKGTQPVLTGISIQGSQETGEQLKNVKTPDTPTRLEYEGMALFRSDKLIGWFNETESRGYSQITDRMISTVIKSACPEGGKLAIEIVRSHSKMRGAVRNGNPEVRVTIRAEANVAEVECRMELTGIHSLVDIEKRVEDVMRQNALQALSKGKKLGTDVFGFGEAIHRSDPGYWSGVEDEWDKVFRTMKVEFDIDVKIRRIGTVGESFLNNVKE